MKKNIIFLLALVFVLASCGKQEVVNNQPTVASDIKVKEIQKIEEKQGPILEDISVDIIKSDASDIKVKEIQKIEEKQGPILEDISVNIIKSDISPDEYDKFLSGALTFSGIDIDSFKKLSNNYFKDKNNIYFGGCAMGCAIRSLTGIDYDSFEIIGGHYSKDKNNVYYKIFKIDGIDSKDFTYIPGGDDFAKSGNNFFVCGEYLSGFNANSFTHLGYRYIKDDKNTYFGGDLCNYTIVTGSANEDLTKLDYKIEIEKWENVLYLIKDGNKFKIDSTEGEIKNVEFYKNFIVYEWLNTGGTVKKIFDIVTMKEIGGVSKGSWTKDHKIIYSCSEAGYGPGDIQFFDFEKMTEVNLFKNFYDKDINSEVSKCSFDEDKNEFNFSIKNSIGEKKYTYSIIDKKLNELNK